MQNLKKVQTGAEALRAALPRDFSPRIGIVLGTGLDKLADRIEGAVCVPYADLPGFPQSTTPSHTGRFFAGLLAGVPVLLQQGRCHLYEGRSPAEVVMGVRIMAACGIRALILTNAAGAIHPRLSAGSLMAIEDQINLTGQSPLTGSDGKQGGLRFPDMSALYDPDLLSILEKTALSIRLPLEKGVYLCIPGPQLETRAETRAYRSLGGDAVGMSTALEAIAGHHMGLRVLGVSCLSNKNLPDCMKETSLEDIIRTARKTGAELERLLAAALPEISAACDSGATRPPRL